jgi:hypothetical protein
VAGVKPDNVASIAVIRKIGLVFQDTINKVPKDSEFYLGEHFFLLTKDQYQNRIVARFCGTRRCRSRKNDNLLNSSPLQAATYAGVLFIKLATKYPTPSFRTPDRVRSGL